MGKTMENKISHDLFDKLLDTAKKSTVDALASSPLATRASKKLQDALKEALANTSQAVEIVNQKVKLKFNIFQDHDIDEKTKMDKDPEKAKNLAVNWMLDLFRDIIDKINDQGEILAFIVTKLGEILDKDVSTDGTNKKHDDFEKVVTKRCDDMEHKIAALDVANVNTKEELEKKNVELEQQIAKKCDALEQKYDEVRQRGLKGNLIISSPDRTLNNGQNIPSLARHESGYNDYGDLVRENDLEMVLRLVHLKTGTWIKECDVIACHPLGKRERNTFILSVNNRAPLSGWDTITRGMVSAENNFSRDNVFINFQLTKKRGNICKEVRRAKKENLIKNYDIDANGRIFVKPFGNATSNKAIEIFDIEDIKKFFPE